MGELWQEYDENGNPLEAKGITKDEAYSGLLHGAAHVWAWRKTSNGVEVLIQKRSKDKHTWPSLLDISAAGHIDLGEEPVEAAIRETKEEIGVDIPADNLHLINIDRRRMTTPGGAIENEFCWVYITELKKEHFNLQKSEVDLIEWKKLADFEDEVTNPNTYSLYVPHGQGYFRKLIAAIKTAS